MKNTFVKSKENKDEWNLGMMGGKRGQMVLFFKRTPKGIQNYYTTKQLIEMVTERMDMFEECGRGRICYINNK